MTTELAALFVEDDIIDPLERFDRDSPRFAHALEWWTTSDHPLRENELLRVEDTLRRRRVALEKVEELLR